jgi:3-phytase
MLSPAALGLAQVAPAPAPPATAAPVALVPAVRTAAVATDADDPALWVDAQSPERSLLIGTNKVAAPAGAVVVFDLDGTILQTVGPLDRPNNVDVEYGVRLGGEPVDVVVATERLAGQLRVWRVDRAARRLVALGAVPVLSGETAERGMPMGIGLYKRPADGALFAIVSPKTGDTSNYLAQYRLEGDGAGGVRGTLVRRFGAFSGAAQGPEGENEIEAVAVDDALGYVYYADEHAAIRKYHADPDHPDAARELATLGRDGFIGQREGIAIYARPDGTGYLLFTDQVACGSVYRVVRREGRPGAPHAQDEVLAVLAGGADSTDGLDATSASLGPRFPHGALVAMNSAGRNFFVFDWRDITPHLPVGR